ncbi:MAG TPA: hypothetical protein VHW44_06160 [Pseudonocardiaceae bacterium]|nr:hypothetical protein [Pseudonocardiaceae bacterium]
MSRAGISPIRLAATSLIGIAFVFFGLFGPANASGARHSAHAPGSVLPPIGQDVLAQLSGHAEVTSGSRSCSAALTGSLTEQVVGQDPASGTDTVAENGFRLTGTESCGAAHAPADAVTVTQSTGDQRGTLTVVQQFPPRYQQSLVLDLTVSLAPAAGSTAGPTVLTSHRPVTLTGTPNTFPPQGEGYRLAQPVDLVASAKPDTPVATVTAFPVTISTGTGSS